MSKISSKNTKPEIIVRSIKESLFSGHIDFLKKNGSKTNKFMRMHGKIYNISRNLHIAVQKGSAGKTGHCPAELEDGNFCARVFPAPALIGIDTPRFIC